MKEISGRTSNTVIRYVRRHRPEQLPYLLEDFDESYLTDEHAWISYQTANILYRRAEKIFGRDDIMAEIGRASAALGSLGLVDKLFRLVSNINIALSLTARYANLFETISKVSLLQQAPRHVIIEDRCYPGFLRTRGSCNYVKGLFYAILDQNRVKVSRIHESQCAVPIWEKGLLNNNYFELSRGRVIKKNLLAGPAEDLGPLNSDGTFYYEGTLYGAPSCVYDIKWLEYKSLWFWLLSFLFYRPKVLETIRRELLSEYEIIEQQNSQLRQSNQALANLLKDRIESSTNLEAKVAERTRELAYTVERLKELDQMKTNFLSMTSHELRTPLTVIKGALSLLLTEGHQLPPARVEKYMKMASNNCDRLMKLIDELLDFSRLESGAVNMDLKEIDLIQLAKETLEEFKQIAVAHKLDLNSVLPTNLPLLVGHPGRVKQILSNLLSNAMKFTPPGGEVKLLLRRNENFAEIVVADTGIGMTESQQKRVFSRFFQVDDSLTREVSGVGLGLAIVKELVEMHEGMIWVESEPHKGSYFFVRLPLSGPRRGVIAKPGGPA